MLGLAAARMVEWGLNQAFGDHFCPSNQRNDSVPWLLGHKSSPKSLLLAIQPPETDDNPGIYFWTKFVPSKCQ